MADHDSHVSGLTVSRRDWLKSAVAASATASFAGCSGLDDDIADTGGDGETLRISANADGSLTDVNLNPWAPNYSDEFAWPLFFEMGNRSLGTGEWVNLDVEEWVFDDDNNELRFEIKDGVQWHRDGEVIDEFTGEDWAMYEHMNRLLLEAQGDGPSDPVTVGWDYDGKTFIRELNPDGYNKAVIENGFPWLSRAIYREDWRDLYERLQDASADSDNEELVTEVLDRTITVEDSPALSGPYMLEEADAQRALFKRNPDHWSAEHSNWNRLEMRRFTGDDHVGYQAVANDRMDLTGTAIPETVDNPPEHVLGTQSMYGGDSTETLHINYGGDNDWWFGFEETSDDNVAGARQAKARQAIAYAIDQPTIIQNRYNKYASEAIEPMTRATASHPQQVKDQLPDFYDQLPPMLGEAQPDRAEEKLEESGLTKENGTWVKPDGEPVTVELESHSWSRELMITVQERLQNLGIETEHVVNESSVLFERQNEGSHAISQGWMGTFDPIESVLMAALNIDGGSFPVLNQPTEFEVPPIGEYDAEPTETIDVREFGGPLSTSSFEENKDRIEMLHWVFSYHLPFIPAAPLPSTVTVNTKHFDWPEHPERSDNGRVYIDEENGAPIWTVFQAYRQLRKNPESPNNVTAKED